LLLPLAATAASNVAPTVAISSAAMRPGTTLMDVVYQVTDPDDATVKVRALAFVNGVRSFANVIRPLTWAEGTEANIGDAIATNVDHTLTWDVAADWNIQLGQVKFEVLAVDSNGVLPFNGITIPAAAGQSELTINQVGLTDTEVFNPLLWFYASGNPNMELANGTLMGSATSSAFRQRTLVSGTTINQYCAEPFLFKLLNISPATPEQLSHADAATRTSFVRDEWLTTNRPYGGTQMLVPWGDNTAGQRNSPPVIRGDVTAIAVGNGYNLALKDDGTVVAWGDNYFGNLNIPAGLSAVNAISAGISPYSLALKRDGTVVGWGHVEFGCLTIPVGLSDVIAIAVGGYYHSLALKKDGSVVAWGRNDEGQCSLPTELSSVTAISAGYNHSLALKIDGTVVAWGSGCVPPPAGLSGVTAISAGTDFCLALKNDGTVVAWGNSDLGQISPPPGLSGVTAISAGHNHGLALKNDGTVVAWGSNDYGQTIVPTGLSGVTAISAGVYASMVITKDL
jgi:hypothetical protein